MPSEVLTRSSALDQEMAQEQREEQQQRRQDRQQLQQQLEELQQQLAQQQELQQPEQSLQHKPSYVLQSTLPTATEGFSGHGQRDWPNGCTYLGSWVRRARPRVTRARGGRG